MTSPSPSLESVWRQAAQAALQGGRRVDPPTESLRRLTEPDAEWAGIAGWPLSALDDRIGRRS
jgi:cytochrome P450